jgi:hypothetical protein
MSEVVDRTVLGSILGQSGSDASNTNVGEISGLLPDTGVPNARPAINREQKAHILAWIDRDSRRVVPEEPRRIFEIQTRDGRSLMAVEVDD